MRDVEAYKPITSLKTSGNIKLWWESNFLAVILGLILVPRFCPKNSLKAWKRSPNVGKVCKNVFKCSSDPLLSFEKTLMMIGGIEKVLWFFEKKVDTKKSVST